MKNFRRATIFGIIALFMITSLQAHAAWFGSDQDKGSTDISDQPFTFKTFREIAKKASPAVVNISTTTIIKRKYPKHFRRWRSPFDDLFGDDFFHFFAPMPENQKIQSLGSGVIIDPKGYILTNHHVVEDVDEIQITTLDGKKYEATVVGSDAQTDIALLKVDADTRLTAIPQGDSDALQVGDWVMAIGNPFGFGHTVTVGVVSAKGRSMPDLMKDVPYQDFIQTDASINPGNSGGPLLDIHGRLVGINAVIASRTGQSAGIGFAIPINMIQPLVKQLRDKGKVTRGWLGVTIQTLDEDLAESLNLDSTEGALVAEVLEDGPAEEGGIKVQDVIVAVNGKGVKNASHLSRLIAAEPVGETVDITVIRHGKRKHLRVKLGERPEDLSDIRSKSGKILSLGMRVQELTPEIARQLDVETDKGVLISEIEPGSPADKAGLRRGDIILEINQKEIDSLKDYRKAIDALEPGQGAVLYIQRGNSKIFIALRTPEE